MAHENELSTMSTNICNIGKKMLIRKATAKPKCSGELQTCLLCDRQFCSEHKSKANETGVCEIDHHTYYRNHATRGGVYPTLEARNAAVAKMDEQVRHW